MTGLSTSTLFALFATFFAAGAVKGVTGIRLPTVAMGYLGACYHRSQQRRCSSFRPL